MTGFLLVGAMAKTYRGTKHYDTVTMSLYQENASSMRINTRLMIDDKTLEYVEFEKDLGVFIDSDLSFENHIYQKKLT